MNKKQKMMKTRKKKKINSPISHDDIKCKKHPWEVHSFELRAEPEGHDGIFVQLAPYIKNSHHHGVHQHVHTS